MIQNKLFPRLKAATKLAFNRVQRVGGVESDPDMALYNTLKPQHFVELMKDYGEEQIVGYIQDMETKRIMNKGGK
jgi:hypothetical protein